MSGSYKKIKTWLRPTRIWFDLDFRKIDDRFLWDIAILISFFCWGEGDTNVASLPVSNWWSINVASLPVSSWWSINVASLPVSSWWSINVATLPVSSWWSINVATLWDKVPSLAGEVECPEFRSRATQVLVAPVNVHTILKVKFRHCNLWLSTHYKHVKYSLGVKKVFYSPLC